MSIDSPPLIRTKNELEGYRGELQYLFSGTGFDLIAGASHLDNDADSELALLFLTPEQVIPNSATIEHSSAYVYTQLHQLEPKKTC